MSNPIFHSQYTAAQIEASIGKSPRINSTTGMWEVWDITTSAYVSTGVVAESAQYAAEAENYKDQAYSYMGQAEEFKNIAQTAATSASASAGNAQSARNQAVAAAQAAQEAADDAEAAVIPYMLTLDEIPGTEQVISQNSVTGNVTSILHRRIGGGDVRSDDFVYYNNRIVETRYLVSTGDRLVVTTYLDHLYINVEYTPAA